MSENKKCTFKGKEYSHGAIVCSSGKELECDRGEWSQTGNTCDDKCLSEDEWHSDNMDGNEYFQKADDVEVLDGNTPEGMEVLKEAIMTMQLLKNDNDDEAPSRTLYTQYPLGVWDYGDGWSFKVARTRGQACAGKFIGTAHVLKEDLISIGKKNRCTRRSHWTKKVKFYY